MALHTCTRIQNQKASESGQMVSVLRFDKHLGVFSQASQDLVMVTYLCYIMVSKQRSTASCPLNVHRLAGLPQ